MPKPPPNLTKLFQFDAADLRENREGQVSAKQLKRLTKSRSSGLFRCLFYGVGVILFIGMALLSATYLNIPASDTCIRIVVFGALTIGALLKLLQEWSKYQSFGEDLAHLQVGVIEGRASVSSEMHGYGKGRHYSYHLVVESAWFSISQRVYSALKSETWCRVYYASASSSKYILAVELATVPEDKINV